MSEGNDFDDTKFKDYSKETFDEEDSIGPLVIIKNIPKDLSGSGLEHLIRKFGNVKCVRHKFVNNVYTVFMQTMDDVLAVCSGLKSTNYGFQVCIGTYTKRDRFQYSGNSVMQKVGTRALLPNEMLESYSEDFKLSAKQYQRPQIQPITLLPGDVLSKYFNITDDAHDLEREALHTEVYHTSYKYNTGRAYNVISTKTKAYIQQKVEMSNGIYNQENDAYISSDFDEQNIGCSKLGACVQCQRDCDAICNCCDSYYCSVQCQVLGHPSIQRENGIISSETAPTAINASHEKQKLNGGIEQMPPSGSIAAITTVCKTNIVFIRSKNFDDNMEYFKIIDGLQRMGRSLQCLTSDAEANVGEVVVVNYDGEYHRAMIMARDKRGIMVYLIDYGNLCHTLLSCLYRMPSEYANLRRLARPVVLKNVPDCYMTQTIREFMYSYLHNVNVVIRYDEDDLNLGTGICSVELTNHKSYENFNETIIKLATPQLQDNLELICYYYDFEMKPLPLGDNVQLVVMDTSCLLNSKSIFCTTNSYALQIEKLHKDIQNYGNSLTPNTVYTPRRNEMCLFKCGPNNEWLRGVCVNVLGDGYPIIHFIDYGCTMRVSIDNIRIYPYVFDFPIFTHYCEIDISSDITVEMNAKIQEILPNGACISCKCEYLNSDSCYKIGLPIQSALGCLQLVHGSLNVERSPQK